MPIRSAALLPHGQSVRYLDFGPGPRTLVLIHGYGAMSAPYFAEFCAEPQLAQYRKLLIDLPGFGLSDRPADYPYTFEAFSSTVEGVLSAAGVNDFDLIGHSMGGAVCLLLAERLAARVRHLVLVEPTLTATGSQTIRLAADHTDWSELSASAGELWTATLRLAAAHALRATAQSFFSPRTPSLMKILEQLEVPSLLVLGADSGFNRQPLDELHTGAEIVELAGAGHNTMLDNPAEFAAQTLRFLGQP